MIPFLGKYQQVVVTYDNELLVVEIDAETHEGFWENIHVEYDVNNPEEFAQGVYSVIKKFWPSLMLSIENAEDYYDDEFYIEDEAMIYEDEETF